MSVETSILTKQEELRVQLEDACLLASQLGLDDVDIAVTEAIKMIPEEE